MRTTLTLDDDVAAALERLRKKRDVGFKELVNDVLRRGLNDLRKPQKQGEPFRTRSVALGRARLSNVDNIGEALAIAEGEPFK
jgi:Ribbon-helix-helix protein, copG family